MKVTIDNRLTLALLEPRFASEFWQLVQQQRGYLSQFLAWPEKAFDVSFFTQFIEAKRHEYAIGKSLTMAILLEGKVVGCVSFNEINKSLSKASIGYWLSRDVQGQGIVTMAVAKLIELGFNHCKLAKVELAAATDNIASQAVAGRLGFTLEGTIRRAENLNGRIVDHRFYGLLKSEWLRQQGADQAN
ncbi:GNAT family N-acetyltransferase [Ferrimonas senticii]|uniref:GNAT family N-acetyltransferase n=1 Tax=Ferrimonas senticii TaxID=394566 RepID=UPI00040DC0E2|nr:GNAT family protein [Ferrimonas senticii]